MLIVKLMHHTFPIRVRQMKLQVNAILYLIDIESLERERILNGIMDDRPSGNSEI